MTDSRVGADFGRLSNTQQHLQSTTQQMNSTLEDLKGYLRPMVSTWTGEASTNYQQYQKQWDQSAADLNQVLQSISRALDETNNQMQSTEKSNAGRF